MMAPSYEEGPSYETLETTTDDDNEEEDDDPELGQYTSDAESSMPTIPSPLVASPSKAELGDYTPKCDVAPRLYQFKDRKLSTKVDVDDAIMHYNRMLMLLGNDTTPPITTCNPSTDSQRTMEPVVLEEPKNVLEKDPKEEIGILYDAITRELAQGRGEESDSHNNNSDGGGRV